MTRVPSPKLDEIATHAACMFCCGIAATAHREQKRKYTGKPYVDHPMRLYILLATSGEDRPDVLLASLLHDVLEDTDVTERQLRELVGDEITDLVLEVTDTSKPEDGNRAERKRIDREHLAKSTYGGATIKLADLIDNSRDIVENDADFAKVYLQEKADLLPVLAHGNKVLFEKATRQLPECQAALLSQ